MQKCVACEGIVTACACEMAARADASLVDDEAEADSGDESVPVDEAEADAAVAEDDEAVAPAPNLPHAALVERATAKIAGYQSAPRGATMQTAALPKPQALA